MINKLKKALSLINTAFPFCLFGIYFLLLVMIGVSFPYMQQVMDQQVNDSLEVIQLESWSKTQQLSGHPKSSAYMANR